MAETTVGLRAYAQLLRGTYKYRWRIALAVSYMILVGVSNGMTTWLIMPVVDRIFSEKDLSQLLWLSLAYPVLFLVKGLANYGQTYIMSAVGQSVIHELRVRIFRHLMALDQRFYHLRSSGDLLARITSDVGVVGGTLTDVLVGVGQHVFSIIALAIVVFKLDWRMAMVAMVVFPLAVIPMTRFGKKARKYGRRRQKNIGNLAAKIVDTLRGVRVVQVFQMEERETGAFAHHSQRLVDNAIRTARTRGLSSPVMELLGGIGGGLVIYLGGSRVISGEITQGTFVAFITSMLLLYDPVKKLSGINDQVNQAIAAAERIFELLDTQPTVQNTGTLSAGPVRDAIEVRQVSFAYDPAKGNALTDVSLRIAAGSVTAIVGPSGAGKSTLLDLIPRFLDIAQGQILWDGRDYREFDLRTLREQIAMVDQQTVLFNGTLRDNLVCSATDTSDDELWRALEDANLGDFVRGLPAGLATSVGEDGVQLSGGQRQRMAIARALLKNAPVLILDEATSALDTASEQVVQQALATLMAGRTTIVVAHRLSTVRDADSIVVLDHSRVVQQGRFEELSRQPGLFAELVRKQSLEARA